jgi:hypothetical protein
MVLCNSLCWYDLPTLLTQSAEAGKGKISLEFSSKAVSLDKRQSSGVRSSSFTAKNAPVSSEAACSRWFICFFLNRQTVVLSDYLC